MEPLPLPLPQFPTAASIMGPDYPDSEVDDFDYNSHGSSGGDSDGSTQYYQSSDEDSDFDSLMAYIAEEEGGAEDTNPPAATRSVATRSVTNGATASSASANGAADSGASASGVIATGASASGVIASGASSSGVITSRASASGAAANQTDKPRYARQILLNAHIEAVLHSVRRLCSQSINTAC